MTKEQNEQIADSLERIADSMERLANTFCTDFVRRGTRRGDFAACVVNDLQAIADSMPIDC